MAWKGWLIEESLEDDTILSRLRILESRLEENDSGDHVVTWHLDTIEVGDKDIRKVSEELEGLLKLGYYAHFTDYMNLLIIFRGKHFRIGLQKVLLEKEFGAVEFKADPKDLSIWKRALDYGTSKGRVDPRHIIKVL